MSSKPKQPFLKKGTRQFLSNAQVRSQHDKPKIVDFGAEEEEGFQPARNVPTRTSYDDKPIAAKKLPDRSPPARPQQPPVVAQRQPPKRNAGTDEWADPAKKIEEFRKRGQQEDDEDRVFVSRKKPAEAKVIPQPKSYGSKAPVLKEQDSYGQQHQPEESGNLDFYLKNKKKPNGTAEKPPQRGPLIKEPHFGGKSVQKKFELEEENEPVQEQLDFEQQYGREVHQGRQYPEYSQSPDDDDEEEDQPSYTHSGRKEKPSKSSSSSQQEYQFDDEQEWGQPNKGALKRSQLKQELKIDRNKLEQDLAIEKRRSNYNDQQEVREQASNYAQPQKSHIVDKFFYRNGQQSTKTSAKQQTAESQLPSFRKLDNGVPVPTRITIDVVPEQVKLQIIEESVIKMKQTMDNELDRIKGEGDNVRRLKIKYEQEFRQLEKDRKELQRETERRKLQFQEFMKQEKAKIAKDKKVIKDGLENRYTRKEKQEFDEMRKQIEDLKEDKKKAQARLRTQVERQKKLVAEEQSKNRQLQQQIKTLEKCRIIERQQLVQVPPPKPVVKAPPMPPTQNYNQMNSISDPSSLRMQQQNFTLSDLPLDAYRFEANSYYQQYCDYRQVPDPLESQREEPERIKRVYRSGKLQHQYIKKYIKEIFTDGYEIIHFVNGDVKQKLPNGVVVYFSSDQQLVEWTINPKKTIYYFIKVGQVEMKLTTPSGQANEVYNGTGITRTYPDSRVQQSDGRTTTSTKGGVKMVSNGRNEQIVYPKNMRGF